MYRISVEVTFRARHFVQLKPNPPEEHHEHEWRVRAWVQARALDDNQVVMDFHELEGYMKQVVKPLAKVEVINELPEFAQKNPSTELIARYIHGRLLPLLPARIRLNEVTVWETPLHRASYRPDKAGKPTGAAGGDI